MNLIGMVEFHGDAAWYLAVWSLLTVIVTSVVGWISYKLRTFGAKIAEKQARMDSPGDVVVSKKCFKYGPYEYVELHLRISGVKIYQIVKKEEIAFKVEDPRISDN